MLRSGQDFDILRTFKDNDYDILELLIGSNNLNRDQATLPASAC